MSMPLFRDLPDNPPRVLTTPVTANSRSWSEALEVLIGQGGMRQQSARAYVGKLIKQGLSLDDLRTIASSARKVGTMDPVSYFSRAAQEAIARRRHVSVITAPSEARMRAWMEEWRDNPASWRSERGPEPGNPRCIVPLTMQQEFGVKSKTGSC